MKTSILFAAWLAAMAGLRAQCTLCLSDPATNCTYTLSGNVSNPSFNLNANERLCILPGATVSGNWNININSSSARVVNMGTIQMNGLNLNTGILINYGRILVNGNITIGSAQVHNHNYMQATIDFNLNGGQSRLCNTDSISVGNNMNTSGVVTNNGVVSVGRTFQQNANGDWCTTTFGLVYCEDLILNGDVFGGSAQCVGFIATDQTTVNGSGTISGTVDICDLNYNLPITPRIDQVTGAVGANVTYCGCSQIPLGHYIVRPEACLVGGEIHLQWRTIGEPPGLEFVVERWAIDEFVSVAVLAGKVGDNQYITKLLPGTEVEHRLRIQARDGGGSVEYSPVMYLHEDRHLSFSAIAYPVPSRGDIQVAIHCADLSPITVTLLDAQGRVIWQESHDQDEGSSFNLRLAHELFPYEGGYWVRVASEKGAQVLPIWVLR